ncbi:hypothetical protein RI367_004893 [Sorochytrium milnesiophthora]
MDADFALSSMAATSSPTDGRYRKYVQAIDRILQSFDTISEWPDIITFLSRLSKTIQAFPQYTSIPSRLTIAKRLSQCLNPALPAGVHQKTIETYSTIFQTIGPRSLSKDASIWFFGLFPFVKSAGMSVKPAVLDLIQTHCLILGQDLMPCLKSLILAILPGLEEEDSEFFDQTVRLLDSIAAEVGVNAFFDVFWLGLITGVQARRAATNYLLRCSPSRSLEEVSFGSNTSLMVRGLAAALNDSNPQNLVQRGALDFMIGKLPLSAERVRGDDLMFLVKHAAGVVLRKDMSLNRRLYSWLLSEDEDARYLQKYGLSPLITAFREMFHTRQHSAFEVQRPFRILISLLDKSEIGDPLAEALLLDILVSLQVTLVDDGCSFKNDLKQTANMFFEMLDPLVLWEHVINFIDKLDTGDNQPAANMVVFLLELLKLSDEDVRYCYLPLSFLLCISKLPSLQADALDNGLALASKLFDKLTSYYFSDGRHRRRSTYTATSPLNSDHSPRKQTAAPVLIPGEQAVMELVRECLASANQGEKLGRIDAMTFSQRSLALTVDTLEHVIELNDTTSAAMCWALGNMLVSLLAGIKEAERVELPVSPKVIERLRTLLSGLYLRTDHFDMLDVSLATDMRISDIISPAQCVLNQPEQLDVALHKLIRMLDEPHLPNHARAVELLWTIAGHYKISQVELVFAHALSEATTQEDYSAFVRFGTFWRLSEPRENLALLMSKPLVHIFDALSDGRAALRRAGETWLRQSVKSFTRVLDPLLVTLYDPRIRRAKELTSTDGETVNVTTYRKKLDCLRITYVFQTLLAFGKLGVHTFVRQLRAAPLSPVVQGLVSRGEFADANLQSAFDALLAISLCFLTTTAPDATEAWKQLPNLQLKAAEFLGFLVVKSEQLEPAVRVKIEWLASEFLFSSVHRKDLDMQTRLLQLLFALGSLKADPAKMLPPVEQGKAHSPSVPITRQSSMQELFLGIDNHEDAMSTFHAEALHYLFKCIAAVFANAAHRPIWQNWIDFSLSLLPSRQVSRSMLALLLMECFMQRLAVALNDLACSQLGDAQLFLYGLERILLRVLAEEAGDVSAADEEARGVQFRGSLVQLERYLEHMLVRSSALINGLPPASMSIAYMPVLILHLRWLFAPQSQALGHAVQEFQSRCLRALDKLYRSAPEIVLNAGILSWTLVAADDRHTVIGLLTAIRECSVDRVLGQVVLTLRQDCVHNSIQLTQRLGIPVAELCLLAEYLIDSATPQLCMTSFGQMMRDYIYNPSRKEAMPYLLRVLAKLLSQACATDDKRLHREVQDLFLKSLDTSLQVATNAKGGSQTARVANQTSQESLNGKPLSAQPSSKSLHDMPDATNPVKIITLLSSEMIAVARHYVPDTDRIVAFLVNAITAVVSPALKDPEGELYMPSLALLVEACQIPYAGRAWKREVWDHFLDNRFLPLPEGTREQWNTIVKFLTADAQRLTDVLNRINPSQATSIFGSRDQENLTRCSLLRRCSYIVYSGDMDAHLAQLPAIQEKLVDMLRIQAAAPLLSEVFLLMKVLFLRISASNLTNLWPIVITETMRVLRSIDGSKESDESLCALLATCKLIDYLEALSLPDFQTFQWIFAADLIDAYAGVSSSPHQYADRHVGLIDQLGGRPDDVHHDVDGSAVVDDVSSMANGYGAGVSSAERKCKRPTLLLKHITSVDQLRPFAARLRATCFSDAYYLRRPDTAFVDQLVNDEIVSTPLTLSFAQHAATRPFVYPADKSTEQDRVHAVTIEELCRALAGGGGGGGASDGQSTVREEGSKQ